MPLLISAKYVDDTLLVVHVNRDNVSHLKMCLDHFAQATGLKINFHNSTVVPMNIHASQIQDMIQILQCH